LRQDGKSTAVWLFDEKSMTVKAQTVEVETADGNDAVIGKGLQPGMKIVSVGVHLLQAGQKVSLYRDKSTTTSGQVGQPAK
jgi:multidrug efflux pump subunit AcrA (membrane-fusion protein)